MNINWVEILTIVIPYTLTAISIYFVALKYLNERKVDLHNQYIKIKELSRNMEANYSEILVVVNSIARIELTPNEIHWFINEPGAFLRLKSYARVPKKYIKIVFDESCEKGRFMLTETVSSTCKRAKERIIIICSFFICLMLFIWFFTKLPYGDLFIFGVGLFLTLFMYYILNLLDKAVELSKIEFKE